MSLSFSLYAKTAAAATVSLVLLGGNAWAKLPAPVLTDEGKAKAAEAAAKTAHAGKLDNFKLCQSMERVAARYHADTKAAGKEPRVATTTAACADPGAFVYPPPAAVAVAPAAAAPAAAVANAAAPKK